MCKHPQGLIYSHKLPGGFWLPGAASNTGGEWIANLFPEDDLKALDTTCAEKLPCSQIAYPLMRKGERFPFLSDVAEGFLVPDTNDRIERYAAYLQGTAFVERFGLQLLDKIGDTSQGDIYSTGGGSRSDVWMQCRADVTGRRVCRRACDESAFGSAILAAAGTFYPDIWQAIAKMVHIEAEFLPNSEYSDKYNKLYDDFCSELDKRGYI